MAEGRGRKKNRCRKRGDSAGGREAVVRRRGRERVTVACAASSSILREYRKRASIVVLLSCLSRQWAETGQGLQANARPRWCPGMTFFFLRARWRSRHGRKSEVFRACTVGVLVLGGRTLAEWFGAASGTRELGKCAVPLRGRAVDACTGYSTRYFNRYKLQVRNDKVHLASGNWGLKGLRMMTTELMAGSTLEKGFSKSFQGGTTL